VAKWETLAGKFSPDEYKIINEYLDKNHLKPSQLVQKAIKFYIPFFTGVNTFKDPHNLFWLEFIQEINILLNSKKYQSDVEKIISKLLKKYSLEQIETKIERLEITSVPISKNVNISRSSKLKRYHQYIRLIRDNFPDLTHAEIRKQFARRRNQEDVSIPDAVWQNPSP